MYHIVAGMNLTGDGSGPGPSVPFDSIRIIGTVTDPLATAKLDVLEQPPALTLAVQQSYVCIDETGAPNPTHNFLVNAHLDGALGTAYVVNANANISLTGLNPGAQFQMTNATASTDSTLAQNVQAGYIVPGIAYCCSIYELITSTFSNGGAKVIFNWLDGSGNVLSQAGADFRGSTGGLLTRISLTATAPAGAVSAQIVFGCYAYGTPNSGTVQFFQPQIEPMWFVNEGVSYPTSFCGVSAINSVDSFIRANQSGWGTASNGEPWTFSGASATESITSDEGVISATGGADTFAQLGGSVGDTLLVVCRIAFNQMTDIGGVQARWIASAGGTCYKFLYGGFGNVLLNKSLAGVNTGLASGSFTVTANTYYWFKLLCSGSSLFAKIWADGSAEPAAWTLTATDTSITSGGYGVLANTNSGTGISFDHFSASDPTGAATYTLPDSTTIRQTRLFAGYITQLDAVYEGTLKRWTLTCASLSSLLEWFYLDNATRQNTLDSSIITSTINANFTISSLYPESGPGAPYTIITTNNVVAGATPDYLSVTDMTFKDLLATLANQSGYLYYVDAYGDLHYEPPGYEQAAFGLSDAPNAAPTDGSLPTYSYYAYKWTSDGSQIKNRIKVFGGKFIAPQITDTFTGDGSTKNFTLSQQPYNVTSLTVAGVAKSCGVYGVHTFAQGYVALYDKATPTLKFNTAPANGAAIVITYTYEANVIVRARAMDSIAYFNGRIFDSKINDTTLNSLLAADQRGLAELVQYSMPRTLVSLTTQQPLFAGESVQFTSAFDNMSKVPLLVQRSELTTRGNGINEWTCDLGAYNPDLVAILTNIHKALLRNPTTAGQTIQEEHLVVIDGTILQDRETHTP